MHLLKIEQEVTSMRIAQLLPSENQLRRPKYFRCMSRVVALSANHCVFDFDVPQICHSLFAQYNHVSLALRLLGGIGATALMGLHAPYTGSSGELIAEL